MGQQLHRSGKIQPFIAHHETNGIATGTATEAVIELPFRFHAEGRGLFVMEGAASLVIAAGFTQVDPLVHDGNNVQSLQQVINKGLWYQSAHREGFRESKQRTSGEQSRQC